MPGRGRTCPAEIRSPRRPVLRGLWRAGCNSAALHIVCRLSVVDMKGQHIFLKSQPISGSLKYFFGVTPLYFLNVLIK